MIQATSTTPTEDVNALLDDAFDNMDIPDPDIEYQKSDGSNDCGDSCVI